MRAKRPAIAVIFVCASLLAAATAASGEATHTYAVALTIAVDRDAGQLSGKIVTDAPSEFCDSGTVRIREVTAGHDRVVARVFPVYGEWQLNSNAHLRGARVYAEVLAYHLPQRPVECLGARSRAVTAP